MIRRECEKLAEAADMFKFFSDSLVNGASADVIVKTEHGIDERIGALLK